MSVNPAIVTPPRPARRLVSPVAFQKDRPRCENSHSLAISSDVSTPSTISMPKIDSCILGKETLEQREKFTVSNSMGYFDIAFSLHIELSR